MGLSGRRLGGSRPHHVAEAFGSYSQDRTRLHQEARQAPSSGVGQTCRSEQQQRVSGAPPIALERLTRVSLSSSFEHVQEGGRLRQRARCGRPTTRTISVRVVSTLRKAGMSSQCRRCLMWRLSPAPLPARKVRLVAFDIYKLALCRSSCSLST